MSPLLLEIERSIRELSLEEQLWLLERMVSLLRRKTQADTWIAENENWEDQLSIMAADPAIQAELVAIDQEFTFAELDGLEQL